MSGELTPIPLSPVAERSRKQIKAMIPETSTSVSEEKAEKLSTEIEGGIMYGGSLLAKKISELVREMGPTNIGKVGWSSHSFVAWLTIESGLGMDRGTFQRGHGDSQ
jgi:hypothetical protein